MKRHLHSFDLAKGILLLFVFAGHLIPGPLDKVFLRYAIYGFHMPLFFAVSGFLINPQAFEESTSDLFRRYGKRLLLPWLVAVAVLELYKALTEGLTLNPIGIVADFTITPHHLWYVIGFMSCIFIIRAVFRLTRERPHAQRWIALFALAVVLHFIYKWGILLRLPVSEAVTANLTRLVKNTQLDKFLFFAIGAWSRERFDTRGRVLPLSGSTAERELPVLTIVALLGAALLALNFGLERSILGVVADFLLNVPLSLILLHLCCAYPESRLPAVEFIGKHSLAFYLCHQFFIFFSVLVFPDKSSLGYYALSIALCCLLYLVLLALDRMKERSAA